MKKLYSVLILMILVPAYEVESITLRPTDKQPLPLNLFEAKTRTAWKENEAIVRELERLKNALKSNSIHPLLDFFEFPISEENMAVFEEEPSLGDQIERAEGLIKKDFFKAHFSEIHELLKMTYLLEILENSDVREFSSKGEIQVEKGQEGEPCYIFYSILQEDGFISLIYGTNTNTDDTSLRENTDEELCGEYAYIWKFRIKKGEKLIFERFDVAG